MQLRHSALRLESRLAVSVPAQGPNDHQAATLWDVPQSSGEGPQCIDSFHDETAVKTARLAEHEWHLFDGKESLSITPVTKTPQTRWEPMGDPFLCFRSPCAVPPR